jgi:hydrogenase maturation protease
MNAPLVDQIVAAVLYEGYILYPYRASSRKNRQRFTFGRVYPEAFSIAQEGAEPCVMQTQCLVNGPSATIEISVRFLQPMWREALVNGAVVAETEVDGKRLPTWQEAVEREVRARDCSVRELLDAPRNQEFSFAASETREPEISPGVTVRRRQEAISGVLEIGAEAVNADVSRITVRMLNRTAISEAALADQDAVLMRTFASTHAILHVREGEFISLLDTPADSAADAAACQNVGVWPVLVGDEAKGERDTMLASPIILYDYPKIAPESSGDLFDGAEIDEILTLRIMTMTDAEKTEMRHVDERARRILERTEALASEDLLRMHGTMREMRALDTDFFNPETKLSGATVGGVFLQAGDQVRIRPKKRADAMDMILEGKTAVIEGVEQDVEGTVHFALVLADDPGKDFGLARMPGHRFFYASDEVEPLKGGA